MFHQKQITRYLPMVSFNAEIQALDEENQVEVPRNQWKLGHGVHFTPWPWLAGRPLLLTYRHMP